MKKIFKEAHKMTKEIASKYDVDYQAQFGLCLAYLLKNKEEKEMIKLYKIKEEFWFNKDTVYDNLYFADIENDKIYELSYNNELVEQIDTVVDDCFDIEDVEEVNISDYYNVDYKVNEKDTYSIKEQIKAEGGKWNGYSWYVPGPSKNFSTEMIIKGQK